MNRSKESKELTLPVPWGHVAAKAWGSPQNPPVLVVHGSLDNFGSFTRLIDLLPDAYYYVAIDLPGHGLSSHFPSGMILDFFNYILAIKYVLDELQWDKFTYIGHSLGAQLGVMFSIVYPDRIDGIVAFDALIPKLVNNQVLLMRTRHVMDTTLFELNKKPSPLYTKEHVLNALMNKRQFVVTKEAAEALFNRAVTKVDDKYKYNRDLRMRSYIFPSFNRDQYAELLKNLRVPTLVIMASVSWFDLTKESANDFEDLKKLLPKTCTFVRVEGNHDVHNNNPESVKSYVTSFLRSNNLKSKL